MIHLKKIEIREFIKSFDDYNVATNEHTRFISPINLERLLIILINEKKKCEKNGYYDLSLDIKEDKGIIDLSLFGRRKERNNEFLIRDEINTIFRLKEKTIFNETRDDLLNSNSAKTSIKQIPAGFNLVKKYYGWEPNTVNLDIGGGRFDDMTIKLATIDVKNIIYDPYNKTNEHNLSVLDYIENNKVNTVTIFNVLNVIKKYDDQLEVIKLAFDALLDGGYCYVRSMYKNPSGKSGYTKSGTFQHYMTHNEYAEIIKKVFDDVKLEHGLIICKK